MLPSDVYKRQHQYKENFCFLSGVGRITGLQAHLCLPYQAAYVGIFERLFPIRPCAGIHMLKQPGYISHQLFVHRPVVNRTYRFDIGGDVYKRQILICSICQRYPHEFILLQLSAGLVAIFSLRELSQRSQLFRTAFLVILT